MKKCNDIKKYVELMDECELVELEIQEKDFKIKLRKREGIEPAQVPARQVSAPQTPSQLEPAQTQEKTANITTVKSPLVGTLYRAPGPGAPAFVKEGDKVEAGKVLCIVEAMKVMNEIKSPASGIIRKIYVENAKMVEYGQSLFDIEAA